MNDQAAAGNREAWLNRLAALMAPRFQDVGATLPRYRIAVGFTSAGMNSSAIGEFWDESASDDSTFEVFIRPDQADPMKVAFILAHELTHAAAGLKCGHKGEFARIATALGFPRPLTRAAPPTGVLLEWLESLLPNVGPMPHAAIKWRAGGNTIVKRRGGGVVPESRDDDGGDEVAVEAPASSGPKKQTTRLLKAHCEECGYTVRVTAKWLEIGPPHCPAHGAMAHDAIGAE